MRAVIAMDSFKGSLPSVTAGNAVREAILELDKDAAAMCFPLADGGEGTVNALTAGMQGHLVKLTVTGPLGTPVEAVYGILPDNTAVVEMAAAAGLPLVPEEKRDPMVTTTYGVGEILLDAISRGCRRFVVGIGGSATNDGGTGMLRALGYTFLDERGDPIPGGAGGLEYLSAISGAPHEALQYCHFRIACDVTNPLCGEKGCSAVFAPQKGAKPEDIPKMDSWLERYASIAGGDPNVPGAGAAGGLGYAFMHFLGGSLEPGAQIVLQQTGIEKAIESADVVITGEGRLDGQSVMGKAPMAVAGLAQKYGKPVIALCGCIGDGAEQCNAAGVTAYFSITPGAMSLDAALDTENAYQNLKNTAKQALRLFCHGR
ncbi:MAG: glycerate kinase [Oscillospiraceae bacterium]|nr:glycerate kinase [Oscillospiraceae bacterium]